MPDLVRARPAESHPSAVDQFGSPMGIAYVWMRNLSGNASI
jgi:hypothetical protein